MLLQLTHEGKVHFSDPAEKYVPEMKLAHNLPRCGAGHAAAAGRPHFGPGAGLQEWHVHHGSGGGMGEEPDCGLASDHFEFEPGTHAAVSNIDDAILALALSRAAHQPYAAY